MATRKRYKIQSEVWLYPGQAAWHFVSIPKAQAEDIKKKFGQKAKGWGSLPVLVTLGKTAWKTSIFPDKKSRTYLLPFKAEVRKKEDIHEGDQVVFYMEITI